MIYPKSQKIGSSADGLKKLDQFVLSGKQKLAVRFDHFLDVLHIGSLTV